jgi:hypothetical protein
MDSWIHPYVTEPQRSYFRVLIEQNALFIEVHGLLI